MHEDYNRGPGITLSSPRTFGFVWTALLLLYGVAPLRHGAHVRIFALASAALLALISLFLPGLLQQPNRLWARVATVLHGITNPMIMGVLFFCFFVPLGVLYRFRKKDAMHLPRDRNASSYWIKREPPGPAPESMMNQF